MRRFFYRTVCLVMLLWTGFMVAVVFESSDGVLSAGGMRLFAWSFAASLVLFLAWFLPMVGLGIFAWMLRPPQQVFIVNDGSGRSRPVGRRRQPAIRTAPHFDGSWHRER